MAAVRVTVEVLDAAGKVVGTGTHTATIPPGTLARVAEAAGEATYRAYDACGEHLLEEDAPILFGGVDLPMPMDVFAVALVAADADYDPNGDGYPEADHRALTAAAYSVAARLANG